MNTEVICHPPYILLIGKADIRSTLLKFLSIYQVGYYFCCLCKHSFRRKREWVVVKIHITKIWYEVIKEYGIYLSILFLLGKQPSIREVVLDEIVLEEINKALCYVRNNTKEFTDYISKKTSSQYRKELNAKTAELSEAEKRIVELKSLFKHLYNAWRKADSLNCPPTHRTPP